MLLSGGPVMTDPLVRVELQSIFFLLATLIVAIFCERRHGAPIPGLRIALFFAVVVLGAILFLSPTLPSAILNWLQIAGAATLTMIIIIGSRSRAA
jgi:hypothetical protein